MIEWFKDEKLCIEFDSVPHVCVRNVLPSSTEIERKSIKKYPFINKHQLRVKITDFKNDKVYEFSIPKGYCWNGSDIPRLLWRIIGSQYDPQYLVASCLHDYMLENKNIIDNNRLLTSKVFKLCLLEAGVSEFKASIMFKAVDVFQRFCCKW